MRIFVTGGTGFAGSHLVDDLLAAGHDVHALVFGDLDRPELADHPCFHPFYGNLLDGAEIKGAVTAAEPEVIYHLAGQALTAGSWRMPALTVQINTIGTINILEAALAVGRPRVVVVTSAEIYGKIKANQLPLTEKSQPQPHHPYAVSKVAAGQLVRIYQQRYDLPAVEARPFNHVGPRQLLGFVVPDFASQMAAIKLGQKAPTIAVGNLDAQRDFTDVRDVVRAYQALAAAGVPGETYIICSGQPVPINYILNTLIDLAGVTLEVTYDPARMRPSDVPLLYGSYAKLAKATGWRPQIHLRQSLADALDEWLAKLAAQPGDQ